MITSKSGKILALITLFSLGLHLYKIDYPPQTVFDEAYYAGQASNYQNGKFFFDVHPPLAKIIFAGVLEIFSPSLPLTQFLKTAWNPEKGELENIRLKYDYGDFPFIPLRVTSAIFGTLIPLISFFIMKNLGAGDKPALLAAYFLAIENALLVDTRYILLNGIFLAFGLAALAVYSSRNQKPILAGILFGMSVASKLSGIIFLGPVIAYEILYKAADKKKILKFIASGLIVYLCVILSQNFFFSLDDRIDTWASLGAKTEGKLFPSKSDPWPLGHLKAAAYEIYVSVSGYTYTVKERDSDKFLASRWYEWPLMKKTFVYFSGDGNVIYMLGNPVLWYWGSISVIFSLLFLWKLSPDDSKPVRILLLGYIFSLVPLAIVTRVTFLNHYFPALIFSICISTYLIDLLAQKAGDHNFLKLKAQAYPLALFLATSGFVIAAQYTY